MVPRRIFHPSFLSLIFLFFTPYGGFPFLKVLLAFICIPTFPLRSIYIHTSPRGEEPNEMVKKNITIAIIIIVIFIILALAGFGIYAMQNHVSFFKKRAVDEETVEEGG